jgi:hypothetical protein
MEKPLPGQQKMDVFPPKKGKEYPFYWHYPFMNEKPVPTRPENPPL